MSSAGLCSRNVILLGVVCFPANLWRSDGQEKWLFVRVCDCEISQIYPVRATVFYPFILYGCITEKKLFFNYQKWQWLIILLYETIIQANFYLSVLLPTFLSIKNKRSKKTTVSEMRQINYLLVYWLVGCYQNFWISIAQFKEFMTSKICCLSGNHLL